MESKTYVFGNEGSTSNNGMLGLLAPLLQKQGVDPNVLLAMKGNNGFGGEGGWFMWVIFLFFLMGWEVTAGEVSAIMVVVVSQTRLTMTMVVVS